jgi:septum formation protein
VTPRPLVLASASQARLGLLRAAGLDPIVVVSGVPEDAVGDTSSIVSTLAARKASAVVSRTGDGLVLGCDSLLDVDGESWGKPASAAEAARRWQRLRGSEAVLLTGHCLIDARTGSTASEVAATTVRFGRPSDAELEAYLRSGEALHVAGGFTLDGRSAPFVDGVDGDPGNVIGVSLPVLRRLLHRLDVEITDLWM